MHDIGGGDSGHVTDCSLEYAVCCLAHVCLFGQAA
jgi:hypothetical protein